jgi:ABC-2 type transport system permease protein
MLFKHTDYFMDTVHRELRRMYHDRNMLFITIIGPVIAFVLLAWIFSANVPRELPVAVVDLDHTSLSRQMTRMVDATPIAQINRNFVSLEEAHAAMQEGDVDAIVFIPSGSEKNVLKGTSANIALYINNTNVLKGSLLNTGIRKALQTMSAGVKLQVQLKSGLMQDQAMSRIMPVQLRQVLLFNPFTSYSYYLTASLMPMIFVFFLLISSIYVVGIELYKGTGPRWIRTAGGNFLTAMVGKLFPYSCIFLGMAVFMDFILFNKLGMPLRGNFIAILATQLLLILAYQGMAIFLLALTSNLRLCLSLGSAYSMLGLTYSGLTFPVFAMSGFSQVFSAIFPFTYWTRLLISQSLRGEPMSQALVPMLYLIFFIVLGMLFLPLLKSVMLNRRRWGKI